MIASGTIAHQKTNRLTLSMPALKYEVMLRLRTIELIALWEGRLITNQLSDWFGVSRQQASADIQRYISEINPDALIHDPSVKGYVPAPDFKPVLNTEHINDYLNLLNSLNNQPMLHIQEGTAISMVQLPNRAVRPEVVREVIKACRQNRQLHICYASMENPAPSERVIAPHTLVYSGFRWHLRAWCYKRNQYRDFVLSRIYDTPILGEPSGHNVEQDEQWQTSIELRLIPNLLLTAEQQALIAHDFAMTNQQLVLTVRQALAQYSLQRYQAAVEEEEALDYQKYPLQLHPEDRGKLAPYSFGSSRYGKSFDVLNSS